MLSDLRAPRELVLLMRLVAIVGATKIAVVVYTQLVHPTPPSAAEIAASQREIAALAEEGDRRVLGDFRARAAGVLEAARRCQYVGDAPCRWAEIWLERYGERSEDVLRHPRRYPAGVVAAARQYRRAGRILEGRASGPSRPRTQFAAGASGRAPDGAR